MIPDCGVYESDDASSVYVLNWATYFRKLTNTYTPYSV